MVSSSLSDQEFAGISRWLYETCGIYLNDSKKPLVSGRLNKRLRELQLSSLGSYTKLLKTQPAEQQIAINLLTTNETYFFREQKHFDFISNTILPNLKGGRLKVWSAAASSGEEAYSIAMLLATKLADNWSIVGTDINTQVLNMACRGVYSIDAADKIPPEYLKRFCLKGRGKDQGLLMIKPELKNNISFKKHNLMKASKTNHSFELVVLRNVLIYFELADKQHIVQHILRQLRPGGYLLVGHSESINGYDERLVQRQAGCYQFNP